MTIASPRSTAVERIAAAVLAAGLLATAVIMTSGNDHFRLPKELAFRAEAIVLAALAVFWMTARARSRTIDWRPEFIVAIAAVAWASITTLTSTNRLLSVDSLVTVIAAAIIFIATCLALQRASFIAIDVLMIGACINAAIVILQELKIWTPFRGAPQVHKHIGSVGLLGNPNDVGTYLAAPALAALVVVMTSSGRRRTIYAAIVSLLVAGIAASGTRTAIAALLAGLLVIAFAKRRRAVLAAAAIVIAFALIFATPTTYLGKSTRKLVAAAEHRNYEVLFSERLVPFLTATHMLRDHPLVGVGPGCFKYHFMSYRVAIDREYPREWMHFVPVNWAEVHNDHLQVLAESGAPGYLLMLAAIVLMLRRPRLRVAATPKREFARALRWPMAALVFVICLAQFPLETAASRQMILTLGAVCLTWDRNDDE